ncbi:MAG: MerR family transcriptional regulator [Bacillati bacterium ANGP1]|uniref:MerR family transcriptional regulator n=1 Tax=Candidatus Segetimicrobium genomatis TaxID=2569760 RepID=A0A537K388_9BACT|nr:MAG: MerR family transcriptional regulator [Terrabacteria group bacterium ANGP1]
MKKLEPDTPVYVISVAADLIGVHPRTLRIYEERGLLSPVRRRRIRLYSQRDIQRVRLIRFLTEERGLNLAGVRMLLEVQEHYHEELTWVFDEGEGGPAAADGEAHEPLEQERSDKPNKKGGRGR